MVTAQKVKDLFADYNNNNTKTVTEFIDFVFGAGDRSIVGDLSITGNETISGNLTMGGTLKTDTLRQNTAAGMSIGSGVGKIGFYDTAPVVQQVLATGAAHSVDDVITFLQLIGLCKQV